METNGNPKTQRVIGQGDGPPRCVVSTPSNNTTPNNNLIWIERILSTCDESLEHAGRAICYLSNSTQINKQYIYTKVVEIEYYWFMYLLARFSTILYFKFEDKIFIDFLKKRWTLFYSFLKVIFCHLQPPKERPCSHHSFHRAISLKEGAPTLFPSRRDEDGVTNIFSSRTAKWINGQAWNFWGLHIFGKKNVKCKRLLFSWSFFCWVSQFLLWLFWLGPAENIGAKYGEGWFGAKYIRMMMMMMMIAWSMVRWFSGNAIHRISWATIAGSKMMSCNFLVYHIIYIIHIHIYVYSLYLIVLSGSAMSLSTAL